MVVLRRKHLGRSADRRSSAARRHPRRSGAALMLAIFVMAVCSMVLISIVDTQTLQFAALRNTRDYDRARYLAEAGVQHAMAILEQDISQTVNIANTTFPATGSSYWATLTPNANGTVTIEAFGQAGDFTRRLEVIVKMGG